MENNGSHVNKIHSPSSHSDESNQNSQESQYTPLLAPTAHLAQNGRKTQDGPLTPGQSSSTTSLPGTSCLKPTGKCSGNAHVQFDTPQNGNIENSKPKLSQKFNGDNVFRRIWSQLSSSQEDEGFRKNKKRRHNSSGSSSLSIGSSSSSGESRTEFERKAPDGGWGWVVVFASFMVHCIADGVTMSFGVLYVEFLSYFQESKSLTSWVGSLFMAVPLLAGPVASWATDRYGCKNVTIWGALIACFGFLISSFVDSLLLLLITVGLITGLGLALCYVAAIVIVAFYFEKKRSLATGIAVAGSGIGTFVFAPFIQYLLKMWGWRGCLIILAGCFLNMVVAGFLMRDLEWTRKKTDRHSTSQSSDLIKCSLSSKPSLAELRQAIESGAADVFGTGDSQLELVRSSSLVLLPTFVNCANGVPNEIFAQLSDTNAYEILSNMYPHLLVKPSTTSHAPERTAESIKAKRQREFKMQLSLQKDDSPESKIIPIGKSSSCFEQLSSKLNGVASIEEDDDDEEDIFIAEPAVTKPLRTFPPKVPLNLSRKNTFCGGTMLPLNSNTMRGARMKRESMTFRGAMFNIHRYKLRSSSCPNIYKNSIISRVDTAGHSMTTYLKDVHGFGSCMSDDVCRNAEAIIFGISNFLLYVFYDTVYLYLTDYAQGIGISDGDSADLISVIGILNCIGMVLMGYVGDQPWFSPMLLYLLSMVICGMSVIVMPFVTNYWFLAAASASFGFFISANYALTSVILVEIISLDAFSRAYGIILLVQGLANLIGPPLVGFLADSTGSYLVPFVVSGIFIIICGLMLILMPLTRSCHSYPPSTPSSDTRTSSRLVDV